LIWRLEVLETARSVSGMGKRAIKQAGICEGSTDAAPSAIGGLSA
jgi:hypothetical protein